MRFCLKLFGLFSHYLPQRSDTSSVWLESEEGERVDALLARLGIPEGEPKLIVVNHRIGQTGHLLQEGDIVAVFPPLGGG